MKKVIYVCDECRTEQVIPYDEPLAPMGWIKVHVSQVNSKLHGLFCSPLCLESRIRGVEADNLDEDTPESIRRNYARVDITDKLRAGTIAPETAAGMLVLAGFDPMTSRQLVAEVASRYSRNQQGN